MAFYNEQHKGKSHFHHQEPNPHWELDLESLLWEQASQKTFQVPEEYRAPTLTLSCKVIRALLQGWFCMPCAPAWAATGVPPPLLAESELCAGHSFLQGEGLSVPKLALHWGQWGLLADVAPATLALCPSPQRAAASGQCPPPSQHCLSLQTSTVMCDAPPSWKQGH